MRGVPRNLLDWRICVYAQEDQIIRTVQDAVDIIGDTRALNAAFVVIPIAGLDAAFFQLRTGLAGAMLQKFVNYGLRVAILGDHSQLASESNALRDFIRESNRGRAVWFMADWQALEEKLATEIESS
jgi:hypothetical protein